MRRKTSPKAKRPRRNLELDAALQEIADGLHRVGIITDRKHKALITSLAKRRATKKKPIRRR